MIRPVVVIATSLLSVCCATRPAPKPAAKVLSLITPTDFGALRNSPTATNDAINDAVRRAVVIHSGERRCSGAVFQTNRVLTASHCIEKDAEIIVAGFKALILRLGNTESFENDEAYLNVHTEEFPPLKFSAPYLGQPVFIVCNQLQFRSVVMQGHIAHVTNIGFLTDIVTVPGCSGGFVYSETGGLVGMHTLWIGNGPTQLIGGYQIASQKLAEFMGVQ